MPCRLAPFRLPQRRFSSWAHSFGGYGALHAWNRVTGQLDRLQNGIERLRNSVLSDLEAAVREYTPQNKPQVAQVAAKLGGHGQLEAEIVVKMLGDVEERLQRVENQVARLPGQVANDINAAIASALEEHKTQEKIFGIKDKSLALAGLVIALIGTLLRLLDQLSVFPK